MGSSKRNSKSVGWAKGLVNSLQEKTKKPCDNPYKEDWRTYHEVLDEVRCGENKLRRYLQIGVENKTIERFEGTTLSNGKLVRCVWYRQS